MNGNDSPKVIELLEKQVQDLKERLEKADTEKAQLLDLADRLQKQNELLMLPSPKKKNRLLGIPPPQKIILTRNNEMFIIDFLNQNDSVIVAFATVVLVVVTILYLLETRKMRLTTQEMLRVSNTPDIQVSILWEYRTKKVSTYDLCIQNIGTGFAYNVKFSGSFYIPSLTII